MGLAEEARKERKAPAKRAATAATALSAELRENAAAIVQELGPKAVDPAQLATALDDAHAWQGVEAKASTFHTYARSQRGAAWDHAVTLMAGMKLGVRFAVARDTSFADRFPGVAKAFAPTRRPKPATATGAAATGTAATPPETPAQAAAPTA